ncbi:LemA family protein [Agitococcus lubricus]|uniref:LemA protein n=1 Tax=Agitococcus lubricus TaxID=1077255 RepID=A0A2T5J0R4_9GAMM|nr:LemA family protein [Agitococcus lubricus]PTQ89851.1 LemA protein [Agitococcus lubricus]
MPTIIFLLFLAVMGFYAVAVYNSLITLRNHFKNAFAQIDVQLQRRYELIPNLVEAVKAYLSHEKETLTQVINARNQAASAEQLVAKQVDNTAAMTQLAQAEGVLSAALGKLMVLSESYPDIKANSTIQHLMEELKSTENRVSFARQAFNDAVMVYNIEREKFPNNIVANFTQFQQAQMLEIPNIAAKEPIKISFN